MRKIVTIAFICWSLGMAYLLLIPGSDMPQVKFFEWQDKVAHFSLFCGWCFLLVLFLEKPHKVTFTIVLIIGLFMAGFTEWLQLYIPHRSADLLDFVADIIGVLVGLGLGFFIKKELFSMEKKFDK